MTIKGFVTIHETYQGGKGTSACETPGSNSKKVVLLSCSLALVEPVLHLLLEKASKHGILLRGREERQERPSFVSRLVRTTWGQEIKDGGRGPRHWPRIGASRPQRNTRIVGSFKRVAAAAIAQYFGFEQRERLGHSGRVTQALQLFGNFSTNMNPCEFFWNAIYVRWRSK